MGQILFYGGIVAMALAVALGVIALVCWKTRASKLRRSFDEEYGEEQELLE